MQAWSQMDNEEFYHALLEIFPWADEYCHYYIYVIYSRRRDTYFTLSSISKEDRTSFSPEKAYAYFRAYTRSKLGVASIILTCNRPKTIDYLVKNIAPLYRRLGADLIIYDSSSDDATERVVESTYEKGYTNVIYKKYTGIFDGLSLDHKVMGAYRDFADEYDYLWLCRDGLIPILDDLIDNLRFYKSQNVDCIIVDSQSRTGGLQIEKTYEKKEDCERFLLDQAMRLQTLGMQIHSSKLAKHLLETIPLDDTTYCLWQMAAPFRAFADNPYKVVFTSRGVFSPNYAAYGSHFWQKAGKTFEVWAVRWSTIIASMPDSYARAKGACMKVYTVDFHPFSPRALLEMRCGGGLTPTLVRKYAEYIPLVTDVPMWYFNLVSRLPKMIARFILSQDNRHHEIYKKIRKSLIHDKRDDM